MDTINVTLDGLTEAKIQLTDIDAMFFLLSYLGMSPGEINRLIEGGMTVEEVLKLYEVKKQEQKQRYLAKGMPDSEAETKADEAVNFISISKVKSDPEHRASIARQLLEMCDFDPEVIFFKRAGDTEIVKILIDLEAFTKLVTLVGQFAAKRYEVGAEPTKDRSDRPATASKDRDDRIARLTAELQRLKASDATKAVQTTSAARSMEEMGMG